MFVLCHYNKQIQYNKYNTIYIDIASYYHYVYKSLSGIAS